MLDLVAKSPDAWAFEALRVQTEPQYFISKYLGDELWSKQQEIVESVRINPITTVRSCHGIGKSFTAADVALWFLNAHKDSIVITTAPTFRQVENVIWRYMRSAHKNAKYPLGGRRLKTRLEMSEDWYAIGVSSDDPDKVQGFHPKSGHILVIIDEAAGVTEDIYVAADAIMSSLGARMLMIGNPTTLGGRFYESHHSDAGAHRIAISCFDTPNFTNNGIETIDDLMSIDMNDVEITHPFLITPQWVKDKVTRWGVESPLFQARCLGQFPSAEINTLIPLNLIEAACTPERKRALTARYIHGALSEDEYEEQMSLMLKDPSLTGAPHYTSADPARYGDDKTVISQRYGPIVLPQIVNGKEGVTQTAGRIKMLKPAVAIFIDEDGVGGGVIDVLVDDGFDNVVGLHNGGKATDEKGMSFVMLRDQLWWNLAELFKSGDIYIPPNSELISQLASIRYEITRRGVKIEEKAEMKKRLHVSPDRADSLMYLFAEWMSAPQQQQATSVGKTTDDLYNEALE